MSLIEGGSSLYVVPYIQYVRPVPQHHRAGIPNGRRIVPQFVSRTIGQILNNHCAFCQLNPPLLRCVAPASQPIQAEGYAANIAPEDEAPTGVFALRTDGKK